MKLVACALLFPLFAASASAAPTSAELGDRLLGDALTPVIVALEKHGAAEGIAVEQTGPTGTVPRLGEFVADFLLDQGFRVFVLDRDSDLQPGQLHLELVAEEASYQIGESQRGFLGLAPSRTQVEAKLAFQAKLSVPETGELLYDGAGAALWTDWIEPDDAVPPASDELLRATARSRASGGAGSVPPAGGWKERAVALGLLTGVIIIYFSGAG